MAYFNPINKPWYEFTKSLVESNDQTSFFPSSNFHIYIAYFQFQAFTTASSPPLIKTQSV